MKETDTDYFIKFRKRYYYDKNSIASKRYPDFMYVAEMKNPYSSLYGNRVFEIEQATKLYNADGTCSIDICFRSKPKLLDYDYRIKKLFDYDSNHLAFYVTKNIGIPCWRGCIFTTMGDGFKLVNTTLRYSRVGDSNDFYYTLSGIIVPDVVEDIDRSSIIPNQMIDMTLPALLPKPITKDEKWPTKPSTIEMVKEDVWSEEEKDKIALSIRATTQLKNLGNILEYCRKHLYPTYDMQVLYEELKKEYGPYVVPESVINKWRLKEEMSHRIKSIELKDVKFSGDKTIAFWEDGEKTIVTMQDDEKEYDPEKAIMACYMKRLIDIQKQVTNHNISIKKIFDKYLAKYEKEKPKIEAQIQKIKQRKANKKENTK